MRVAITARMRNGFLWSAVNQLGSQSKAAEYLGVSPTVFGCWLNFKSVPSYDIKGRQERRAELDAKLLALTGATFEEVFPTELRSDAFKRRHKQIDHTMDIPIEQLAASGAIPRLAPAPDEYAIGSELKEILADVLQTLSPREEKVVKMRFGLGDYEGNPQTFNEIAGSCSVTSERVRQIERKALRKMRHPSRSRLLQPFVDVHPDTEKPSDVEPDTYEDVPAVSVECDDEDESDIGYPITPSELQSRRLPVNEIVRDEIRFLLGILDNIWFMSKGNPSESQKKNWRVVEKRIAELKPQLYLESNANSC